MIESKAIPDDLVAKAEAAGRFVGLSFCGESEAELAQALDELAEVNFRSQLPRLNEILTLDGPAAVESTVNDVVALSRIIRRTALARWNELHNQRNVR